MKNFTERKPYNPPLGFYKKASKICIHWLKLRYKVRQFVSIIKKVIKLD